MKIKCTTGKTFSWNLYHLWGEVLSILMKSSLIPSAKNNPWHGLYLFVEWMSESRKNSAWFKTLASSVGSSVHETFQMFIGMSQTFWVFVVIAKFCFLIPSWSMNHWLLLRPWGGISDCLEASGRQSHSIRSLDTTNDLLWSISSACLWSFLPGLHIYISSFFKKKELQPLVSIWLISHLVSANVNNIQVLL